MKNTLLQYNELLQIMTKVPIFGIKNKDKENFQNHF